MEQIKRGLIIATAIGAVMVTAAVLSLPASPFDQKLRELKSRGYTVNLSYSWSEVHEEADYVSVGWSVFLSKTALLKSVVGAVTVYGDRGAAVFWVNAYHTYYYYKV